MFASSDRFKMNIALKQFLPSMLDDVTFKIKIKRDILSTVTI